MLLAIYYYCYNHYMCYYEGTSNHRYGLTWSDPGQVSVDYHGGQHDSRQTKSSCNSHKLLVVRQRRAPAKYGGTAHTHASARPTDTRTAHVQQRASHFTTTKRFSRSVLSRPVSCALPCSVSPSVPPPSYGGTFK